MTFHVMTLFPELIEGYMAESIMKRAAENEYIKVKTWNIRDYSENKHKKVDDYPYGGGAGMVMAPGPIWNCFQAVQTEILSDRRGTNNVKASEKVESMGKVIYLSPKGQPLTNQKAVELSKEQELILLCGHYEGIDQRVLDSIVTDEISIGDYVLTGGELPALVLIDSISRHIQGVLGDAQSLAEESFSEGLLEYPQYTRPESFHGIKVPAVLLSGNHQNIHEWRRYQSICLTKKNRPDIFQDKALSKSDDKLLEKYKRQEEQAAMKKAYEVIFFDADNTLLDFSKAEREALKQTMNEFQLEYDAKNHLNLYVEINEVIWKELEEGLITQEELKTERFRRFFHRIGQNISQGISAAEFGKAYLENLSAMAFLMEGAVKILKYAKGKYKLAIITNGIKKVQKERLKKSGLEKFMDVVIISEEAGAAKPAEEIFSFAMKKLNCQDKSKALMIGDSISSDILGGINFGMDTCWMNLKKEKRPDNVSMDYEIHTLKELENII